MTTFEERVQALPAEIYNEIYDLTFKTAPGVVCVHRAYQFPALLHVDQASRQEFSKSYFGEQTIFYIDHNLASEWRRSMDKADFEIQSEVRIASILFYTNPFTASDLWSSLSMKLNGLFGPPIKSKGLKHDPWGWKFQVAYGEPQKKGWIGCREILKDTMNGWANRSVRAWCEWNFGEKQR